MGYLGYYEGIHESCILMERLEGRDLFQVLLFQMIGFDIEVNDLFSLSQIIAKSKFRFFDDWL